METLSESLQQGTAVFTKFRTCVGVQFIMEKEEELHNSGRIVAVVAVEILDKNSRFTEKHSS